jgi:trimethylamine--corrinoid protein Co-methyltransferase
MKPFIPAFRIKVLTDDQVRQIHEATLTVLEEIGVSVQCREALDIMASNGCRVDHARSNVRIPEAVLKKCLATAPSEFTLHGRTPEQDVRVTLDNVWTIGGSSALFVCDLEGNRHPATLKDLADLTRLQDALENLHIMHAIAIPQDIPQEGFDRILFSTVMKNTNRNYYSQGMGAQSIRDQVEMAAVLLGSREQVRKTPNFTIVTCLVSPLVQPEIRVEEIIECARHGIPVYIEVDSQPGGTTPVTLAGTLVEECANVLCGVCLAQMVQPGHPCVFASASGVLDMATGNYSAGAPDTTLLHAATAQMAHHYQLPFQGGTGIDATIPDAQAGYERGLQVLTNILATTNFVHLSIGMLDQMMLTSYDSCVVDNEILGAAYHIARGIEVTPQTLALDVIRQVGPGGEYISHEHTLEHFRNERWFPRITNHDQWVVWQGKGGLDMRQRAVRRAKEILDTHRPQYITPAQGKELDLMARRFQEEAIKARRSDRT